MEFYAENTEDSEKIIWRMDLTELHDGEIEDILYLLHKRQKFIHMLELDIHYSAFGPRYTFIRLLLDILLKNPFLKFLNICYIMDKDVCKTTPLPFKM